MSAYTAIAEIGSDPGASVQLQNTTFLLL